MKPLLVLLLLFAQGALAQVGSDSLRTHPPVLPPQIHKMVPFTAMPFEPRMEDDGLVLGDTKYFIRIWRPDPRVDYKILRANPDIASIEKMPLARPHDWKLTPHLKDLRQLKKSIH